jgi:hypothetical protein
LFVEDRCRHIDDIDTGSAANVTSTIKLYRRSEETGLVRRGPSDNRTWRCGCNLAASRVAALSVWIALGDDDIARQLGAPDQFMVGWLLLLG